LLFFYLFPMAGGPVLESGQPSDRAKPVRKDVHGDPLPEMAVARLGTVRFRQESRVWAMSLSPDGTMLASAEGDYSLSFRGFRLGKLFGWIRGWDTEREKEFRRLGGDQKPGGFLFFSADNKLLASADNDGKVRILEVSSGKEVRIFLARKYPPAIAFSPQG